MTHIKEKNQDVRDDKKIVIYFFIMIKCIEDIIRQTTQQIDNEPWL